ncbi:MAG: SDR family NAD(P)-dependent oxidoreductase [Verrucomicrobiaceae bacterium]
MTATHQFTQKEVDSFAELSGDWNPLHTNPVVARRTSFGGCVVHGVLVLLRALEYAQGGSCMGGSWQSISARFLRPVQSGTTVTIICHEKSGAGLLVTVADASRTLAQFDITSSADEHDMAQSGYVIQSSPPRESPENPAYDVISAGSHPLSLYWSAELGFLLFPVLAQMQPHSTLAALLAATRVIGMKMPGEHSVFLQLELDFTPAPAEREAFSFCLEEFRRSSQRLGIAVTGKVCRGKLWALRRPEPVKQLCFAAVKLRIPHDRFAGRHVIVIGGSRGLGEIAAKVLAAGGADVVIGYRLGAQDAAAVVDDIVICGGKATALKIDVANDDWRSVLEQLPPAFDHVCYFATPPISEGDGRSFNEMLFRNFHDVYVTGLVNMAQHLADRTKGRFGLFNASSIYVEDPPLRHLEYASAKAASEACCRWLTTVYPDSRIHVARFPRLLTDQTASFVKPATDDALDFVNAEISKWLPDPM